MNMKKKIATLGLVAAMLLTSAGATLAYFTDTDAKTNTFTTGNVKIELVEKMLMVVNSLRIRNCFLALKQKMKFLNSSL